tara:strand:+ start:10 stop:267 length:258 start_codon:yes stop_codon:yes gene_type:complete
VPIAELNAQHITGLIKMKTKDSQKPSKEINNSVTNNFIIIIFYIFSIFFESIVIIISLVRKGILKKEVLSKRTNLGFDLIIKRKQ